MCELYSFSLDLDSVAAIWTC